MRLTMAAQAEWMFRALRSGRRHLSAGRQLEEKWLTLPPVAATATVEVNGKRKGKGNQLSSTSTTALKWIVRCCPNLPISLLHKLFRLRQVRLLSPPHMDMQQQTLKRVAAKYTLNAGDRILLPQSVQQKPTPTHKPHSPLTPQQINFIRKFVIFKDPAILVLNKPPGMPVQGGINIKHSLDAVAAACLNYEYSEPPRLVHRLDRDCSGLLVMGRTQTSTTVLHSIFREKTSRALDDIGEEKRILQRRYWALVLGCPRRSKGLVTASLGKVVVDNGKSDRITVVDNSASLSSQHAITEYRVIASSSQGYTWLELSPLTGRKHQLRVHCAEVLGTPIVGDYKYGWQAHRQWGGFDLSNVEDSCEELFKEETLPFGLNLNNGSISENHPRLHLHCKQIVLPNISQALQNVQSFSNCDLSQVERLELVADLPLYMQRSWDVTNC
ncbi:RNA pseudouridine synthase 4, mitochondrial isoform X1 [Vigna radiata var. radiata]|uniref:RNA pseudouridine synthase 4, mitochondrial isoform X1 n=1 Tax=Vigna radiata var. radiata TaxID=3916 RepID=A0A1S3VPI0_VIGRR|nr:RNA pseudouridine synthase 4, mitochondrial isoform X1 [Vigna radiata var. radiata]